MAGWHEVIKDFGDCLGGPSASLGDEDDCTDILDDLSRTRSRPRVRRRCFSAVKKPSCSLQHLW